MPASRADPVPAVRLMGVRLDGVDRSGVIDHIVTAAAAGRGGWVATPNVDILRQTVADTALGVLVESADLVVADGMPLVWACRLQGTPLPGRVAGSELVVPLSRAAASSGMRVFLLGDCEDVTAAAAEKLEELAPGVEIGGMFSPQLDPADMDGTVAQTVSVLHEHTPDLAFCAFGFPKQELLMRALSEHFPGTWFVAIGGSLSMLAGRTPPAPVWLRRAGLEWVHRLRLEPRRLFRRYVIDDLPFALRLLVHGALARFRAAAVAPEARLSGSGRP